MEKFRWQKGVVTALAALILGLLAFLLLFGNPLSQRLIYTSEFGQSLKLLDVWKSTEPLPAVTPFFQDMFRMTGKKLAVLALLWVWTLGLVRLYSWVQPQLPRERLRATLAFGGVVWLNFFFFEIFSPFNILGEPFLLVCYELFLEGIIALAVAWTVVRFYS